MLHVFQHAGHHAAYNAVTCTTTAKAQAGAQAVMEPHALCGGAKYKTPSRACARHEAEHAWLSPSQSQASAISLVLRNTGSSLIISTSGGSFSGVPVGTPAASGKMPEACALQTQLAHPHVPGAGRRPIAGPIPGMLTRLEPLTCTLCRGLSWFELTRRCRRWRRGRRRRRP